MRIWFPRLTKLSPTPISSLVKLTEEIGELSREIQRGDTTAAADELLDVAQVCATLMFLVDPRNVCEAVALHQRKLVDKGYLVAVDDSCGIWERDGDKVFSLPRLNIEPTLCGTMLKLSEEAGELAQVMGKFSNLNGERNARTSDDRDFLLALLDVVQTCVTMLYVMMDEESAERMLVAHKEKLRDHGYL